MTKEVATRICYATGVDGRSLFEGDDPLLDLLRRPFSKNSINLAVAGLPEHQEIRQQLLLAAWEAAQEKKIFGLLG
jgi:hypothetical protein